MAMLSERQKAYFEGRNWGQAATLRPDGSVHLTPVWVEVEDELIAFNTTVGNAKDRYLRNDPRVTVLVLDQSDPQRGWVSVTGTAELSEEGAVEQLDRLSKKYIGLDPYPWLEPGERRVIVRVTPEIVSASGDAA